MGLDLEVKVIAAYVFGLVMLYVIGYALYKLFHKPLRWIGILLFNGCVGGVLLLIINFIGGSFDFHMALNPITALTVGFLGIPGVILIVLLQNIL